MLKDFLVLAAQSIAHRKLRSWLTVIGVFIGITAVVALISIGLGLERTIKDQVAKVFGVDTFMLAPEGAFGAQHAGINDTYQIDVELAESVPGVKTVAAVRDETGFVVGLPAADGKIVQGFLPVMGLSPELVTDFAAFTGEIELEPGGRSLERDDRHVAILGAEVAGRLNAGLGDTIEIEDQPFEVVGVIVEEEAADQDGRRGGGFQMSMGPDEDTIYVPFDTLLELYGPADNVVVTLVKTVEGADVDEVADRLEKTLQDAGYEVESVTYSDISDVIGQVTSTISAFLAGIAGISLLVGGVGVMNTMFTSVLERTKEIGVMKAVGAKNGHILSIFLIESGLMGLVGGIVGTLLGLGLSAVASGFVERFFNVDLAVVASPLLIVVTLLGSFGLGAFAGLWPARRAAKLPPVDALRYE
jgi:putative ABC transport system permease protein